MVKGFLPTQSSEGLLLGRTKPSLQGHTAVPGMSELELAGHSAQEVGVSG